MSPSKRTECQIMLEKAGARGVTSEEFQVANVPRFAQYIRLLRKHGYRIEETLEHKHDQPAYSRYVMTRPRIPGLFDDTGY